MKRGSWTRKILSSPLLSFSLLSVRLTIHSSNMVRRRSTTSLFSVFVSSIGFSWWKFCFASHVVDKLLNDKKEDSLSFLSSSSSSSDRYRIPVRIHPMDGNDVAAEAVVEKRYTTTVTSHLHRRHSSSCYVVVKEQLLPLSSSPL